MKERPILFSSAMAGAILDGRKTQTRRIPTSANSTVDGWHWSPDRFASLNFQDLKLCADESYKCGCLKYLSSSLDDDPTIGHRVRSVYDPGDRLWVRETWATGATLDHYSPKKIAEMAIEAGYGATAPLWYIADNSYRRWSHNDEIDFEGQGKTRVSIHMPRWASRITLEILDVRVQRLQEISEEDAQAEGIETDGFGHYANYEDRDDDSVVGMWLSPIPSFASLWDSINGKKHPWAANPWVWAITFKRFQP